MYELVSRRLHRKKVSNLLYVVYIFELADNPAMHFKHRVLDVVHRVTILHGLPHHRGHRSNGALLTVFRL